MAPLAFSIWLMFLPPLPMMNPAAGHRLQREKMGRGGVGWGHTHDGFGDREALLEVWPLHGGRGRGGGGGGGGGSVGLCGRGLRLRLRLRLLHRCPAGGQQQGCAPTSCGAQHARLGAQSAEGRGVSHTGVAGATGIARTQPAVTAAPGPLLRQPPLTSEGPGCGWLTQWGGAGAEAAESGFETGAR